VEGTNARDEIFFFLASPKFLQTSHLDLYHNQHCTERVKEMANSSQQSRLLQLPPELRLQIYGYVFGEQRTRIIRCYLTTTGSLYIKRQYHSLASSIKQDKAYSNLHLLRVCRKLHDEAGWFLGSRQTLQLACFWWNWENVPLPFVLLDRFAIPKYCIGGKVEITVFLTDATRDLSLQRARNALAMLRPFLRKANIKTITAVEIWSENMATTEDWSYELSRSIPALGSSIHASASTKVQKLTGSGGEYKELTSSLLATIRTVEKCSYANSF